MSLAASAVMVFILGTILGSFLNVVIYRLPRGLSIVRPGSRCPHCHTLIRPRDNIPLVSFLILRGRCRACHAPISTCSSATNPLNPGNPIEAMLAMVKVAAANGSALSPFLVRTISMEMWTRSSAGASATSRTRPHSAPEASVTGEPSSSVSAIVLIV